MSTNPLTVRDKLNAKWVVLIGAVIALLGFLLSAVDHVVRVGVYTGDDTGWFLNTPFTSYSDLNGVSTFTSVLDGDWLHWLFTAVSSYLLSAVATALAVLAVALLLFYVLKGHRMARGTVALSLSLLTLSVGTVLETLRALLNWILGIVLLAFVKIGGFDLTSLLTDILRQFQTNYGRLIDTGIGLLIGGGLLIGAVALLLSPRVGKVIACVGISVSTVLTAVSFLNVSSLFSRLFHLVIGGDMDNPTIVWIPANTCIQSSDILSGIGAVCMLLLCAVLLALLITNRPTPVFTKKTMLSIQN